jgi:GTPase SAR1 family protein
MVAKLLLDMAGQEDLAKIRTMKYPGTDCCIVCYSVYSRDSFVNVYEKVKIRDTLR